MGRGIYIKQVFGALASHRDGEIFDDIPIVEDDTQPGWHKGYCRSRGYYHWFGAQIDEAWEGCALAVGTLGNIQEDVQNVYGELPDEQKAWMEWLPAKIIIAGDD